MTALATEERAASIPAVNAEHPWPGLVSFTEESRDYFFGRESDAEELLQSIRRTTLTILYGKSGLGKTSLLRAGLFPRLRGADFLPIYVRLDHAGRGVSPVRQIKEAIRQAFASEKTDAPMPGLEQTLWEYFHGQKTGFWKEGFIPVIPVLVFDQFEELFTIGRAGDASKTVATEFVEELAALVENVPPPSVKTRLDANPNEAVAFSHEAHLYKIVLSLREDYLAELEDLARVMPSLRYNRLSLRPFTGLQAAEVIVKPGAGLVEEGLAPRIIRFVAASTHKEGGGAVPPEKELAEIQVEPALLSLFCRELNNKRIAAGRAKITGDLLEGTSREILADFYEGSMHGIPAAVRAFIEDDLVTVDGFRDSEDLGNALRRPGFSPDIIDHLVGRRIVRIEDHHGHKRIELTHDILTGLARSSRELRQTRLAGERASEEKLEAETRERSRVAQLRKARIGAFWSGAFGLLFFALACLAGWSGWKAVEARKVAEGQKKDADDAKGKLAKYLEMEREYSGKLEKSSAELSQKSVRLEKTTGDLQSTRDLAQLEADRSFQSLRLVVSAGRDLVNRVVQQETGIDSVAALKLLNTAEALYDKIPAQEANTLPEVFEARVELHFAKVRSFLTATRLDGFDKRAAEASQFADDAIGAATALAAKNPENANWRRLLAMAYRLKGDVLFQKAGEKAETKHRDAESYAPALAAYQKSFEILDALRAGNPGAFSEESALDLAQSCNGLGDVRRRRGEQSEALGHYLAAKDLLNELKQRKPARSDEITASLADSYNKIGNVHADQSDAAGEPNRTELLKEALANYQRAEKDRRELVAKNERNLSWQRNLATSCANLAGSYAELKLVVRAAPFYEERILIDKKLFAQDPNNVYWRDALAAGHAAYARQLLTKPPYGFGDSKRAVEHAREAVTLTQERNREYLELYRKVIATKDRKEATRLKGVIADLDRESTVGAR